VSDVIVSAARKTRLCVSGGFDPLHKGHIEYIREASHRAAKLGDGIIDLTVILNTDEWLTKKKGKPFMNQDERAVILSSLKWVNRVVFAWDKDGTVVESLRQIMPDYFAKGGDRTEDTTPEVKFCKENGIGLIFGCGEKIQSSSELLRAYENKA
jgi:D-beta-D-heptose 7-phosphate kinase/D-beta-D-heptose 1-phosphate adenosyltransferase